MNDLMLNSLRQLPSNYHAMVQRIVDTLPAIQQASNNFYKSASQFKSVTLDNTALTPIRTIKQILAECDRTRMALEEAHIKTCKTDIEIRRKRVQQTTDVLENEMRCVEIQELEWQQSNSRNYMKGAVRKLSFQVQQYQHILSELGVDGISEDDYEKQEARYHIMTAFKQALCAARSRGGIIDEGNHIYLFDLGINGAMAQAEVSDYLEIEQRILKEGKSYTHMATLGWLRALADRFEKCPAVFARERGLVEFDSVSLLKGNGKNDA